MNKEAREFDLINLNDYKSYYQDTTKEEIINDTYLDYCAYRNTLTQLNIANKKLDKIEKYIKENACYSETKKECLCGFSSMALDKILKTIGVI